MQVPPRSNQLNSTYVVQDQQSEEELTRLTIQNQMLTTSMGGVLPEQTDPTYFERVLDVGCASGGWVIETAQRYPSMKLGRVLIPTAILIAFLAIAASGCSITIGQSGASEQNGQTSTTTSTQPTGSTNSEQIARAVFNAINADRKSAGLAELQWSNNLVNSAHAHNLTMQKANQLAHQIPGEAAFGDREHQAGIQWQWAAENIGYTTDQSVNGALGLHKAMMAEKPPDDGHRQNILAKEAAILGVDILIDKQNGKLWLTEDFAHL